LKRTDGWRFLVMVPLNEMGAFGFWRWMMGTVVKKRLSVRCPDVMMGKYPKKWGTMTAVIHSKSERIDVRASAPVKQLLQEAARVAHKNVSEFLLDAGIIAANQTLADRTRFELSDEKWLAFQAALDQPVSAKRKPKLKKLLSEPGLLG
jgi:uncharacterized protein (DUF1778 family)